MVQWDGEKQMEKGVSQEDGPNQLESQQHQEVKFSFLWDP